LKRTDFSLVNTGAASASPGAAGPYATTLVFVVGVLICAIPFNFLLMRKPLDGRTPLAFSEYVSARGSWHFWGISAEPLVYRRNIQFRQLTRARRRSCCVVFHRPGRHHDLRGLGRLRVERVRGRAATVEDFSRLDVHSFSVRTERHRTRSDFLEINSF
jgi:hypothetical protein